MNGNWSTCRSYYRYLPSISIFRFDFMHTSHYSLPCYLQNSKIVTATLIGIPTRIASFWLARNVNYHPEKVERGNPLTNERHFSTLPFSNQKLPVGLFIQLSGRVFFRAISRCFTFFGCLNYRKVMLIWVVC